MTEKRYDICDRYIEDRHTQELTASKITNDIAALNFRSFDGSNENDVEEAFTLLVEGPDHNNNGTLAGKPQNDLANTLRSGGWIFDGYKGVCVKPNSPRKVKDENGKDKDIKYESPRGQGKLQLLIPRISVRAGLEIVSKLGEEVAEEYRHRIDLSAPGAEDPDFWDWYLEHDGFIIITEGAKKACSLVSNGYPAIALNGMWGWGTNIKDMFGNVERDDLGKSLKTIHPDLEQFLDGREIILALDREADVGKAKMVEMVKAAFVRALDGEGIVVTDLKWRNAEGSTKGIDDYLAAKGVKALDRSYVNRSVVAVAQPPKQKQKTDVNYSSLANELGIVLVQDGKGNIKSKLVELTIDLFKLVGDRLKLNQMTQEYEYEGKQLDLNHIKNFISHNLGYDSSTENCIQAVHAIASKFAFHPVHKYLESLRDIAIVDFELFNNIATLFLGNSDPLANKMMAKALIGAVARVNKPGTKVDTLPVLQGGQGFLKSTFLKVLSGEFWFCDDIRDLENKDELAKLARYWIIELAEVDYLMGRKEVESFKRFLSTTADTYRPPYGRSNIRHERTCTLFATTNKIEFLKDPTGSRRYWVIKVGAKIDCNLVAKFRDIIWATALAAYDRGDTWWLDDNDELAREERSEEFREPDAWEEIIDSKWDNLPIADYKGSDRVEIDRIFDLLDLDNDKRNKPNRNRIASILKLRGFENKTINTDSGKVKAWLRSRTGVDFTQEELTQNEDFKNKVLGKYSFLGSNSSITTSEKGFEVELNMELNSLGNEKEDYHQNSSQHGESLELNLEPNYRNSELNDKQELSVMESELSSTAKELSSSSCLIPELFSAQKDINPSILEPELSSISNAVPESILPLMEPKNLRKEPFHTVQKNNSEEITRFKVGDRVEIITTGERGKLGQWYRDRKKATIELGNGIISDWVEIADLRSLESEEIG
jgi:predicted P-loop ATPase